MPVHPEILHICSFLPRPTSSASSFWEPFLGIKKTAPQNLFWAKSYDFSNVASTFFFNGGGLFLHGTDQLKCNRHSWAQRDQGQETEKNQKKEQVELRFRKFLLGRILLASGGKNKTQYDNQKLSSLGENNRAKVANLLVCALTAIEKMQVRRSKRASIVFRRRQESWAEKIRRVAQKHQIQRERTRSSNKFAASRRKNRALYMEIDALRLVSIGLEYIVKGLCT